MIVKISCSIEKGTRKRAFIIFKLIDLFKM